MTAVITSELGPGSSSSLRGTIAVDMDDVLAETNVAIIEMHNKLFPDVQPPVRFEEFKNYLYWKNRGWGTAEETANKVRTLLDHGLLEKARPVPGAKEGLETLKKLGYRVIIITARSEAQREATEDWLALHMPDIIDEIHFTGAFSTLIATKEEREGHAARKAVVSHKKRSKADVVHKTHALLLVDDSAENAVECAQASPPVQVLLFGQYGWNEVVLRQEDRHREDKMTYVELEAQGEMDAALRKREERLKEAWLPQGVERVRDWKEVVRAIEAKTGSGAGPASGTESGSGTGSRL